jgi:hypothetical protein
VIRSSNSVIIGHSLAMNIIICTFSLLIYYFLLIGACSCLVYDHTLIRDGFRRRCRKNSRMCSKKYMKLNYICRLLKAQITVVVYIILEIVLA